MFGSAHGFLCLGLLALVLPGCAIKRNGYDVPQLALPAQYKNSIPADVLDTASVSKDSNGLPAKLNVPQEFGMVEWWRSFGNSELVELVDRGLANNPDVRIATLRIAQAKARADQARAGMLPTISAPIGVANQAPGGSIGSVPVGGAEDRATQKSYQASVRGSWRVDVWGEQSSLAESAKFQLWQAAFDRDNVQRNMAANLASSYVEYLSLNDRLRVARETESVLSSMLTSIEKRVGVGDATRIDFDQQKAAIFAVRATIPNLEQQREDALTTIAFLVGTVPGTLKLSSDGLDALYLPAVVPALPSSLLLRRPDVRMVEARLLAADADIDVARARILPPLDLSAQMGYSSLSMSRLFQPSSLFWNALANLTVSIFDGGKLASEKEHAQAIHEEMLETYTRTIYQAVREVESALAAIRLTGKRLDAQQEATASARRAWDSSVEVYAVGGLDYLALLDTERTYHRYLDEYQRIKMDRYRGYISLFQALGGGVNFAEQIPGKGVRPTPVRGAALGLVSRTASKKVSATNGVDWVAGSSAGDGGSWQIENFWQVELPGLYHRSTIGATWRDLRTRYPKLMENRAVRPRLNGRIEDGEDGQLSLYRLYVSKFATQEAAHELCAALQANYQRCRVVSSRSDETVAAPPLSQKDEALAAESSPDVIRGTGALSAPKLSPAAVSAKTAGRAAGEPDGGSDPALISFPVSEPESTAPAVKSVPARPAGIAGKQDKAKDKLAYTVQLGAFTNLENAAISHAFWRFKEYDVYVSEIKDAEGRILYAVRTGVFPQRRDAAAVASSLRRKEDAPAVLVPTMVDKFGKPSAIAINDLILPNSRSIDPVVPEPPEAPKSAMEDTDQKSLAARESSGEKLAYAVQLGAYSGQENAAVSFAFWQGKGYVVYVSEIKDVEGRTWYAVRTGVFQKRRDASALALLFGRKEDASVVVVQTSVDKSGTPGSVDISRFLPQSQKAAPSLVSEASVVQKTTVADKEPKPIALQRGVKRRPAYAVQLGAFATLKNAAKLQAQWQEKGYKAYVCEIKGAAKSARYAVRTGVFAQRREASAVMRSLKRKTGFRAMLVPAVVDHAGKLAVVNVSHLLGGKD